MRNSEKLDEKDFDRPVGWARAPLHSLPCATHGHATTRACAVNDPTKEINK